MKKAFPGIALLLTFVLLIGTISPAFADEDTSEGTTAGSGETSSVQEAITVLSEIYTSATEEETPAEESTTGTAETTTEKSFSLTPVTDHIYNTGMPALTTETFLRILEAWRMTKYLLTGRIAFGLPEKFDVTVSDDLKAVCDSISEKSCLDVYALLTNLPDVTEPAELIGKVFEIDVTEYREEMYAMREEYNDEGNTFMANVCWLVGAYMSGIEKAYVYIEPMEGRDYYQVCLDVTYSDGTMEKFTPEIYINLETGECFGPQDQGMMRIGFNSNFMTGLVYAPIACWMKSFGFCMEYDILCYLLPVYCYNTRRFHFDYNNKEYMIQVWKGNYFITNGGEVGVYYRDPGEKGTYYDVVEEEDELVMSLKICHGDDVLVDLPATRHWWVNGFKLGTRIYSPHSLQMYFTIEMADEEMLKAFTAAVDENICHDVTYTVDGLTVSLAWLD